MKTLRIFISSPGDVVEERERAKQVIDSLKRRYAGVFQLKPLLWEDLPLQADTSFQDGINAILAASGIDIAIFILWARLGSPQGGSIHRANGNPYRSGTERELDMMLEARRQSGGTRPDMIVYTRRDESSFEERLRGKPTSEKQELLAQKHLVESFITEEFQDAEKGVNLRAFHVFDRPQTFSQRLRAHLVELLDGLADGHVREAVWDIDTQGPPFMGLEAFGDKQAAVFCGRESEILEARRALAANAKDGCAFLLLTGSSGSGKSSLARAGLLPAIAEHELDDTIAAWRTLAITPSALGADLLGGLVARLAEPGLLPALRADGSTLADLATLLAKDPKSAVALVIKRAIAEASPPGHGGIRLLLLIDQLEELFALEGREPFLAALEALARSGVCWVVATVRGDFLGEVQQSATLVRLIAGHGLFPVLAPDADALRRMIEEPARLAGLYFEEKNNRRLSDKILADAARHNDLLPMVGFVLRELFDQRTPTGTLTWQNYDALGGVEGALARRADEVLASAPAAARAALPGLLKRIVTLSEVSGGVDDGSERLIRRRIPIASIPAASAQRLLLDAMIAGRLLTAEAGGAGGEPSTVTLAHEALLRVWPVAAAWAGENRALLRTRARLEARMIEGSPLLQGDPLLDTAKVFLLTHGDDFTPELRAWIEAAITTAQARETRARRRRRIAFATLTSLTLLALAGASWATKRERDARTSEQQAIAAERATKAAREQARQSKATAEGLKNIIHKLSVTAPAQGDLAFARNTLEKSLQFGQPFNTAAPGNAKSQRDPAIRFNKPGGISRAKSMLAAARAALEKFLEIDQRLPVAHARIAQRHLSIGYNHLGCIAQTEGDLAVAREAFENSLEIDQRLATVDPRNAETQRDLCVSFVKLAGIYELQEAPEAKDCWRAAYEQITIMQERVILAPADEHLIEMLHKKIE